MSDSVRPHRWKPTRLPRPWDSPGKNTGVGCHFLLQCVKVKSESEVAQSYPALSDPMDCSLPGSAVSWDFPGKSTGVGCHCLLQNNGFLHDCYSKVQPLLLTLDKVAPPDLEGGVAPLSCLALVQPPLLGHGVAPLRQESLRRNGLAIMVNKRV